MDKSKRCLKCGKKLKTKQAQEVKLCLKCYHDLMQIIVSDHFDCILKKTFTHHPQKKDQ